MRVGRTHFGPVPASFDVVLETKGEKNADGNDFYAEHIRALGYSRLTNHPNPVPEEEFIDAYITTRTIGELDRWQREGYGPFFAFCSMLSPHGPFDPPGQWASLYDDRSLPEVNVREGETASHPAPLKRLLGLGDEPDRMPDETRRLYHGLAAYCDHQVGRLTDYLGRTGLRDNTLVIFTSDHGQETGDRPTPFCPATPR